MGEKENIGGKDVRTLPGLWVPLKEMRKFEREVEIKEGDESQIVRE